MVKSAPKKTHKLSTRKINNISTRRNRTNKLSKSNEKNVENKHLRYLIKSDYLRMNDIRRLFNIRGNWEEYNKGDLDFLYLDGQYVYDKKYNQLRAKLKNLVNDDKYEIAYKHKLYQNIISKYPKLTKFVNKQHYIDLAIIQDNLDRLDKYRDLFINKVYIFKPIGGFKGTGIKIIETFDKWIEYIKDIIKQKSHLWKEKKGNKLRLMNEWVLEEYVRNPLTLYGKKFHLRLIMLYQKDGNCYYFKKPQIILAEEPYKNEDYDNMKIHDTHFKDAQKPMYFPDELFKNYPKYTVINIIKQIQYLLSHIITLINAGCYKESKLCYELFGVDLMITDNFQLKLIEINNKVGLRERKDDKYNLNTRLFSGILENVVDIHFPPMNNQSGNYLRDFILINPVNKTSMKLKKSIITNENKEKIEELYNKWKKEGYPYANKFINPVDLLEKLKKYNIKYDYHPYNFRLNQKLKLSNYRFNNKYISIDIPLDVYNNLEVIVDYYTEKIRLECHRKGELSVIQHYTDGNLLKHTLNNLVKKNVEVSYYSLRDEFYNYPGIYYCSSESPLFYKGLLEYVFGKKVSNIKLLDGTTGYGSRLMAAIIVNCHYIGIDPNTEVINGLNKMIDDLGNKKQKVYIDALPDSKNINKVFDNSRDIVMFSPPSFDTEVYSDDKGQSILLYPNFEEWKQNFLYKSLDILWSKVKVGGYFMIQSIKYDIMHDYIKSKNNSKFAGIIARKTFGNNYKPNYFWEKLSL